MLGTEQNWPILFSLIVVPALLQIAIMPFCKESPRYLLSKGEDQSAIEGKNKKKNVDLAKLSTISIIVEISSYWPWSVA